MRKLENHTVTPENEPLSIMVLDEPSFGGVCHQYNVDWKQEYEHLNGTKYIGYANSYIHFQEGPVRENGVNGITEAALLAILIDRYEGFQSGPYACATNAIVLLQLREALANMHARTRERMARNVEDTSTK